MAGEFNPDVPLPPVPNFETLARPTYFTPKPDTSGEIRGRTIANAIEEGARGLDEAYKTGTSNKVREAVDSERDPFTSALEQTKAAVESGAIPASAGPGIASTGGPSQSLLPGSSETDSTKETINSEMKGMQTIQAAYDNRKISESQYWGNLASKAQGLRAQYPGYRDHIDEEFKRITGRNPANAYVQSMVEDIQRAGAGKDKEYNESLSMGYSLMKEGVPDAYAMVHQLKLYHDTGGKEGWSVDKFNMEANKANAEKYQITIQKDRFELEKMGSERSEKNYGLVMDNSMGVDARRSVVGSMHGTAIEKPENIAGWIQKMRDHPDQANMGEQATRYAMGIKAAGDNWESLQRQKAMVIHPDGSTDIQRMGGTEKFEAHLKETRAAYFDNLYEALTNKDYGLTGLSQRLMKADENDTMSQFYGTPTGKTLSRLKMLGEMGYPKEWVETMNSSLLQSDVPQAALNWVTNKVLDVNDKGKPVTTLESIAQDFKDKKMDSEKAFNFVTNNIIGNVANIHAPDDVRVRNAQSLFSPKGRELLSSENFEKDYKNPKTGAWVSGRYNMYSRLGSDAVASGMANLAKAHPELGTMYKDAMEDFFARHLFTKEIEDLNNVADTPGLKLHWNAPEGKAPSWSLSDPTHVQQRSFFTPQEGPATSTYHPIQQSIDRLNMGLKGLYNSYKYFGGDIPSTLLTIMENNGIDITKTEGIPEKLMKSIIASHESNKPKPEPRIEDTE